MTQPFHGYATWGLVMELVQMRDLKVRGLLGVGSVTLETAGTGKGDIVKGSFSGTVFQPPVPPAPAR